MMQHETEVWRRAVARALDTALTAPPAHVWDAVHAGIEGMRERASARPTEVPSAGLRPPSPLRRLSPGIRVALGLASAAALMMSVMHRPTDLPAAPPVITTYDTALRETDEALREAPDNVFLQRHRHRLRLGRDSALAQVHHWATVGRGP